MLKKIKEMKKVGKVKEVQEELVEKSAEEKELEIKLKKKKLIIRTAVMWGLVVILGLLYHRAEVRANNPEIVFTRTDCLLYTSPSPRDRTRSRMPSSA